MSQHSFPQEEASIDSRACKIDAFLLTRQWSETEQGMLIELWFLSALGPIYLHVPRQNAILFIRKADLPELQSYLNARAVQVGAARLKNYKGEEVCPVYVKSYRQSRVLADELRRRGFGVWEEDIRPADRFLMERFVTGGVSLQAEKTIQHAKFLQLERPRMQANDFKPQFKTVSVDIETSMDAKTLYSIGVYGQEVRKVFIVDQQMGEPKNAALREFVSSDSFGEAGFELVSCNSEVSCLRQFFDWLHDYDPDILIGWSFVQFDLWVLESLCRNQQIPFAIGRGGKLPSWRQDKESGRRYVNIPGRVALDGIEVLKTAAYNFQSYSLQNVSHAVLGESKLLSSSNRGEEIGELYKNNKPALAEYNLQDCALVWKIFEQLNLLDFCLERARLTGLPMDRAGGSVAAFEFSYLPRLHRKGYVAPNLGELDIDLQSPGGYVLDSTPGIYRNVLVLDFKSLYPSIIRTFCIDPYSYWYAQQQQLDETACVPGFHEAFFAKDEHILPGIIETLWAARERAKQESQGALSQAIKIIMNSFYGVLGSQGCRFFDPRVCSSITMRGHEIIQTSKEWIEDIGYRVIYGDTDSVFVWVGDELSEADVQVLGTELAIDLNRKWQEYLRSSLGIESFLEMEFETHYVQFLMPTIRNSSAGSKKRYAGLVRDGDALSLQFKGLENVRTDWTDLAKTFQHTLYERVFADEPVEDYVRALCQAVYAGEHDAALVYKKRLRRRLDEYVKNIPPQVQAARKLAARTGEEMGKGDWIAYVITVNGPEPIAAQLGRVDYEHYIQKQLKPVADGVLQFRGVTFDAIVGKQLSLF